MLDRFVPNMNARPREASPWACGVAAVLVTGLGLHVAVLIGAAGQVVPAPPAGWPPAVAAVPRPAVAPLAPLPEPPPATAVPAPAPEEPAVDDSAIVEEAGPEWTRKPLPLPNPALLQRMATMPPGMGNDKGRSGGLDPLRGYPVGRSGVQAPPQAPAAGPKAPSSGGNTAKQTVSAAATPASPAEAATGAAAGLALPAAPTAARAPGVAVTPEAPLRVTLATNRGREGRYRRGEWVVLRMAASAPCYATLYRVGASGEVKQALAPEEKPAGSYGVAIKAGDYGTGEEWVVAIASVQPLPESQVIALLRARPETVPDGPALNAVLAHLTEGREAEAMPSTAPEPWGYAMVVARYEIISAPEPPS